ncbi:MAG: FmdB family zinc ribbon protein [Planctomycetota bacterium]
MPLFDFQCSDCNDTNEILLRSPSDAVACPTCGSRSVVRQIAVPATPNTSGTSSLPVSTGEPCEMPRCCGGGCQLE